MVNHWSLIPTRRGAQCRAKRTWRRGGQVAVMGRVLIVDDEKSIRVTLSTFLRQAGYEAHVAGTASEAAALLATDTFDVAVVDVLLGRDNGLTVARNIYDSPANTQTVLMTGEPEVGSARKAIRYHVFDYLAKPVRKQEILNIVGLAVAAKRQRDEYDLFQRERQEYLTQLEERVEERTAQLTASEKRFRVLFEGSLSPVAIYDRDANIVMLNHVGADNLGKPLQEILGKPLGDFIPEIHALVLERVRRVLETGEQLHVEDEVQLPEGNRWFLSTMHPVLDSGDRPHLVQVVSYDITERKRAEEAFRRHAALDNMLAETATELVGLPPERVDEGVNRGLADVGELMGADRSYVFLLSTDGQTVSNTHEWCAPGVEPQIAELQDIPLADELPWFASTMRARRDFVVPSVADLPPEASREKAHFEQQDIQSLVVVPMVCHENLIGFMGFDAVRALCKWSEETITVLRNLAAAFAASMMRAETERTLRQSGARLEEAQRIAHIGSWEVDLATGRATWSDELYRIMGIAPGTELKFDELMEELVGPNDRPMVEQRLQEALATGELRAFEFRTVTADGRERFLWSRGRVIENAEGEPVKLVGINQDVTERKRAEERHAESEHRYQNLVELAPDSIIVLNRSGRITECNKMTTTLTGYDKSELIGKRFTRIGALRLRDIAKYTKLFFLMLRGDMSHDAVDIEIVRKDGSSLLAEAHAGAIRNGDRIVGIQVIARDLSQRGPTKGNGGD
jgi:PAS domain S-box-containing protein